MLHAYSAKSDGFESQLREHQSAFHVDAPGLCLSMDRGYDGAEWPRFAKERSLRWVIRAKSTRKYSVPSLKSTGKDIREIASAVKGRYAFYFPEPGKKGAVEVKATAARAVHKDFGKGIRLAMEFFPMKGTPDATSPTSTARPRKGVGRPFPATDRGGGSRRSSDS